MKIDHLALEVYRSHIHNILFEVDAHEVTRIGLETVNARQTSSAHSLFAKILHKTILHQLADQLGDSGYAHVHLAAEIGYTEVPAGDVMTYDLPLNNCGFVTFPGLCEK